MYIFIFLLLDQFCGLILIKYFLTQVQNHSSMYTVLIKKTFYKGTTDKIRLPLMVWPHTKQPKETIYYWLYHVGTR